MKTLLQNSHFQTKMLQQNVLHGQVICIDPTYLLGFARCTVVVFEAQLFHLGHLFFISCLFAFTLH